MSTLKTKRQQVVELLASHKYREAMAIAKDFRRDFTPEVAKQITRAFEMTHSPALYEAMGFRAEIEFTKAKASLMLTYFEDLVEYQGGGK